VALEVWRHGRVEAKRLKSLEEENGKLKRLLADAMLDVSTLREMLGKNF
jgi:putative transposase